MTRVLGFVFEPKRERELDGDVLADAELERETIDEATLDDEQRGLFPGYLDELRHTALLDDDEERLVQRARAVRDDPVTDHLTPAPILEGGHSRTHAAELFLHSGLAALPVVDRGTYAGMLDQRVLCDVADDLLTH